MAERNATSPFDQAFAELDAALIDLDGDGIPDVQVPRNALVAGQPKQQGGNALAANPNLPSGGALPNYEFGQVSPMSKMGLTPEAAGSISGPAPRPQDYMQPVAETVAPFVPIPGLRAAEIGFNALMTASPKLTGGAAGLAALTAPSLAGGEEERQRVMDLQQQMRDAGLYNGPIDGVRGPETKAGEAKLQEYKANKQQQDMERLRLSTEAERAAAEKAKAEAEQKATEQRAKERQAGEERMREMESQVPWYSKAIRDYGPVLGYAAGAALGIGTRGHMTNAFNRESAANAGRMNALVSGSGRDFQGRVGGVNQFWQEGGANAVPFTTSPRAARGVTSNREAPSASTLYPPPMEMSNYLRVRDAGVVGGGAAEAGFGHVMAQDAHREVQEAQDAVSGDPSEANIQRLQAAIDRAALWETTGNIGRGAAGGYLLSAPKMPYRTTRPDVAAGEAERLRLDAMVSGRGTGSAPRPSQPRGPDGRFTK